MTNYLFVILYSVGVHVLVLSQKASAAEVSLFLSTFLGVASLSGWHTGSETFFFITETPHGTTPLVRIVPMFPF